MIHIYLIRHGRQNSTLCNVDVELSKEGITQAELLGDRLTNYGLDSMYCSNLIRARQTADIANYKLQLPINIREDIKEISFGRMEGQTREYIEEHFQGFKEEHVKLLEDIPYPEGEDGKSVYERAKPVIQEMLQSGKNKIGVVTHGGVIRVLLAAMFGKNQAKRFLFGVSLENTSITEIIYNPEFDRFYLERFNDYAHLEGHPELLRKNW